MKLKLQLIILPLLTLFFGFFFTHSAFAANFALSGSVKDNGGSTIGSATVHVYDSGTTTDAVSPTTTDASTGNYSFSSIPQGTYDVQVTPPSGSGFSSAIAYSQTISTDTTLNFILTTAGTATLEGHLYDAQNHALAGQTISLLSGGTTIATTTTDSNGSYSFQVATDTYTLDITNFSNLNNNFSQNIPQRYDVTVNYSLTQDTALDLTLPIKKVTMHVQDSSNTPIVGAMITVLPTFSGGINSNGLNLGGPITDATANYSQYDQNYGPLSNSSGDAILWLLPTNSTWTYIFTATPPSGSNYLTTNSSRLAITADTNQTIVMQQPGTITGHLYDAGGTALKNQTISLQASGTNVTTTTDNNGLYTLAASPGTYTLDITNFSNLNNNFSQNIPQRYDITVNYTLIQGTTTLDLTIPAKKVSVHVQDALNNGITGAMVTTLPTSSGGINFNGLSLGGTVTNATANYSQYDQNNGPLTNASGDATIWLLPNNGSFTYKITVTPPVSSTYLSTTLTSIKITQDTPETIVLQKPAKITGHLYDSQNNALINQTISLMSGATTVATTTTDSSGAYTLNASIGSYVLDINNFSNLNNNFSQNIPQRYEITANYNLTQDTTLDLTLPVRKVTVHVQDAFNSAVSGIMATVLPTSSGGINSGGISLGNAITNATANYSQYDQNHGPSTDSLGNEVLWLFSNNGNFTYMFTATPPSGSIYSTFTLNNINVTGDQTEIISLQYNHATPTTTSSLATQYSDGTYSNPTTVTLSAAAAASYTVADTYYKVDGGSQQTYSAPFTITGDGNHTITYWSVDNSGVTETHNTKTFIIAGKYSLTGTVYVDADQNGAQNSGEDGYDEATVTLSRAQATNYIYNPSAEANTTAWSCYDHPTQCTLSRITNDSKFGTAAFRVQSTTASPSIRHRGRLSPASYGVSPGDHYCYSAYVKVNSGKVQLYVIWLNGGVNIQSGPWITSNTWTYTKLCSTVPAGTTQADVKMYFSSNADVYIDGIQFEANVTTPTPYFDGSFGTDYSWSGTANNSTSIRSASTSTATTNSNGVYTFSGLAADTYTAELTVPTGYTATTTNPTNVVVSTDTTQNFGIAPTP